MIRLAALLLLAIGVTHFGYELIAKLYQDPGASKAWFYILRGMEGAFLYAVVMVLANSRAVAAVCSLGMIEEGLTAACRLSKPIGEVPAHIPFQGLCGEGWYTSGLIALAVVATGLLYELGREKWKKSIWRP